jgi:hypothetical protein
LSPANLWFVDFDMSSILASDEESLEKTDVVVDVMV